MGGVVDTPDERPPEPRSGGTSTAHWVAVAVLFGGAIFTTYLAYNSGLSKPPSDAAPTQAGAASIAGILLAGAVTFFLALGGIVTLFHALRLTNKVHPLGLPEGTIHALIALTLIFLFFVMAVFLYIDVSQTTNEHWLYDQTSTELANLPAGAQVLNLPHEVPIADATPNPDGTRPTETLYDVLIATPRPSSDVAAEIARQLVTSLGTLIAAIAAFYFGAKSLQGESPAARITPAIGPSPQPPVSPAAVEPRGSDAASPPG